MNTPEFFCGVKLLVYVLPDIPDHYPHFQLNILLSTLAAHARLILILGLVLGLIWQDLAALLRPLLVPSIVAMLGVALLGLDWTLIRNALSRVRLIAALSLWVLIASPLVMWLILRIVPISTEIANAWMLTVAAPPIVAIVVFAQLLKLDAELVVAAVVVNTLLLPLTLIPLAGLIFPDADIALGPFFLRAVIFIGLPFAAAAMLRRLHSSDWWQERAVSINGFNVIMLIIFAVGVMDGVAPRVMGEPGLVIAFLAASLALNLLLHLLGYTLFSTWGRRTAFSAALVSGNRNLALMMALAADYLGADFALYLALAQVPIFIAPAILGWFWEPDAPSPSGRGLG